MEGRIGAFIVASSSRSENNVVYTRKGKSIFSHDVRSEKKYEGKGEKYQGIIADAIPVKAICSSSGIILKHKRTWKDIEEAIGDLDERLSQAPSYVKDTIGRIVTDEDKLMELKERWNMGVNLKAATDGGYGDDIGSSGVALLFEEDILPIIKSNAAEESKFDTIESTREELLAMLSLEYILDFLAKMWGYPSEMVTLTIVTDSESAKIEREKEGRTIGTRPMLAPNQEIKLELKALEKRNRWIDREVKWVESHLEGKNEGYAYYNELNRIADELATEAREEVLQGRRKPGRHHIFPAARVGVKIRGQVVANKLTTIIKKQSGRRRLKKHLRTKNGWDDTVFEEVD